MAAGADHRWSDYGGTILNASHATHVDGTLHIDLVPVGCHIQTGVDAWPHLNAGDLHLPHVALKNAADRLPIVGHFANIHPLEFHGKCVEWGAGFYKFREEIGADVEGFTAGDVVEDFRFEDVNARVDHVTGGFLNRRLFLKGEDAAVGVGHHHAIAAHLVVGNALGDQARHRALGTVTAHSLAQVEIDQCISAKHHKGVIEEGLEVLNTLEPTG